jgi:transmembrane sensor
MNQKLQAEELMARYFSGNISAVEKEQLLDWVDSHEDNRSYFDEIAQLWGAVEDYEVTFEPEAEAAWEKVATSIEVNPSLKVAYKNTSKNKGDAGPRVLLRIAAAVLFLVIATYWWTTRDQMITIQTALQSNQFELPDGTQIWLNQNSKITYDKAFKKRDVALEGEAFFDVIRDESKPFTINSGATQTRVLGTSFNVRAYPEDEAVIVTVTSGSVELAARDVPEQKVILKVNEAGIFQKTEQQVAKKTVDNDNSISWKTQKLSFNNTSMKAVFEAMERHFGVTFEVTNEAIWHCEFFGTYDKPKLNELLEIMSFAMGLEFEENDNHYTVKGGDGCGSK